MHPLHCLPRPRPRLDSQYTGVEEKLCLPELCSLDSLPDECLYEILRRLPRSQERSNSACVSKRWLMLLSTISSSDLVLKKKTTSLSKNQLFDLEAENVEDYHEEEEVFEKVGCMTRNLRGNQVTDVRITAMAVCASTGGGFENLNICGSHPTRGLTDVGLTSISRCCPLLKCLSLWNVPFITDAGLSELANGCSMLEMLDLNGCPGITANGLIAVAEKCPNLVFLTLDHCINVGDDGICAIGRFCPKLYSVSIKECDLIGDHGITGLVASSSSLTKLNLQNLGAGDPALASIGYSGKSITELQLSNLENVGERGFCCMGAAKGLLKLHTIVINSCPGMTDIAIGALRGGCPSLKQLHLKCCYNISDKGLTSLISRSNRLQHLVLEQCHGISLYGLHSSLISTNCNLKSLAIVTCLGMGSINMCSCEFPSCKSLQILTIRDCPSFTSTALAEFGKIFHNLVYLELSGLVCIDDAGLSPLIMNNDIGLRKVSLRGCENLTDIAICALLKHHGDTLQVLNLNGCSKLTDRILLEISLQCTLLEELDMSRTDITDYGAALLASARHLSFCTVSLSGCSKITSRCLPLIGNMGTTLTVLNLQHCNSIDASSVSALEKKLYWCRILY